MIELLDVLDGEGKPTGNVKDKVQIYKDGDWFRSVHIWIVNDKKEILLQKRSSKKTTFPNLWAVSVSGHVMAGESSMDAVVREIKEELNMDIDKTACQYLFTVRRQNIFKNCINRVFDEVYLVRLNIDVKNVKLQKSELCEIKYFELEYLKKALENRDERFVPMDLEKETLFKYLARDI